MGRLWASARRICQQALTSPAVVTNPCQAKRRRVFQHLPQPGWKTSTARQQVIVDERADPTQRDATPEGPRYIYTEMGNGNTTARAGGISLDFKDSYCQFNVVHINQDGLIR